MHLLFIMLNLKILLALGNNGNMGILNISNQLSPNVIKAIREGYHKCDTLWLIKHKVSFKVCSGYRRNGYCKKIDDFTYEIYLNKDLTRYDDILEVVVHELLHSYPTVFNDGHKKVWAERAKIIRKIYNINVQRTNSFERSQTYTPKYQFQCTKCKHIWDYHRKPKWYDILTSAKCPYCHTQSIKEIEEKA